MGPSRTCRRPPCRLADRKYANVMRSLKQVLATEAALDSLQARRQRELELQQNLQRALPAALFRHVRVATRLDQLELVASSGAAAALIRQRVPDVLHKLAREGWEFTGIRVRVQARLAPGPAPKRYMEQLDDEAARILHALAANLGAGPLASALERLASHAGPPAPSGRESLERVEDQDAEQ